MRRSPIVLGATIAGTAGILAFHPHAATVATATAAPASTGSSSSSAQATSTSAAGSGTGSGSGSSGGPGRLSGTATGDAVATQYGNVQVRVTVRNGKIVTVDALQLTGNDPRSAEILAYAAPILQQEVLTKQTAGVDAVSGATYTSAGYVQSLQSALDKLGFKAPDGSVATLQVP
jgi:uncharacterized protein with FMN-binding domain